MAGRFLLQKLSSPLARAGSTSLFGTHASASVTASAPAIRTASEGGIRTLRNIFHGATTNPTTKVLSNRGIRDNAARHFNTVPCSHPAADQTRRATTGMPSVITNGMKPVSAGSVRRSKRSFSSARQARWDPVDAEVAAAAADFSRFVRKNPWLIGSIFFVRLLCEFLAPAPGSRSNDGRSGSRRPSPCDTPTEAATDTAPNPEVQSE